MKSNVRQKALASFVNILIVMTLSLPIYLHAGWETGRISSVILWFLYNLLFRRRCVGMMVAGTYLERPASILYVTLYTLGFSTFFWSVLVPCDLLLANALCQIVSIKITGNTLHGWIGGQWTMREA